MERKKNKTAVRLGLGMTFRMGLVICFMLQSVSVIRSAEITGNVVSNKTTSKGSSQSVTDPAKQYNWKAIGKYACHGLPDVHQDPKNPDNYIIAWQRYIYRPAGNKAMDVKFAIYNAKTGTISPERYVFDPRNITIKQGHPCWGYSHGKYRIFYDQKSGKDSYIAEVTADKWSDFQNYEVSQNEPVISPELSCRPFKEFLALDGSTAWLFYENWKSNEPDLLSYSIFTNGKGWDKIKHPIPTGKLIGKSQVAIGSALEEGNDIVLYAHVAMYQDSEFEHNEYAGNEYVGNGYRFKTSDRGKAWTVEELQVSGISEPFKESVSGNQWARILKKGSAYYLSSQSNASHRWLAKGNDGVHFKVVADFGERPSLGNAMVNIEGTRDILLVYANYPDGPWPSFAAGEENDIECLIFDAGESD